MSNISFIVPAYNVEKFIGKALLSIIDNKWNHYSYEIIVVDDESPDQSIAVVRKIIQQNVNLPIQIISQNNKGLGGARNTGINCAKGDYLFFLDSDDYILPYVFTKLLDQAYTNNLDVLEFAAQRVDDNYKIIDKVFLESSQGQILSGEEYVKRINFANSACNKLYRREFLLLQKIVFLERVYIEDAPFNIEVFLKAKRVSAYNIVAVAFLQNRNSITRSMRTGQYLEKFINDSIFITEKINHLSNFYVDKEARDKVKKKVAYFLAGILHMIFFNKNYKGSPKNNSIKLLKDKKLLPYYHKSGSTARSLLLYTLNILSSCKIGI